jgi:heat shock protein HtpX
MNAGSKLPEARTKLPPRRFSLMAWSVAGLCAVAFAFLLTFVLGLLCLGLGLLMIALILTGKLSSPVLEIGLGVFGLLAGASLLWSLVPRKIPFESTGVPMDLDRQPRLAAEIRGAAEALGQQMPTELYLVPEANAFVAQPSGRRRILAIGIPLLQTLSTREFRALLAHEFAHFYSGDTKMAPLVYRGRETLIRVYKNLGSDSGIASLLRRHWVMALPHMLLMGLISLYWRVFLRLTQLLSRKQEFRSDELACWIAGSGAMAGALENVNRCDGVLQSFWKWVVAPVAMRGFHPKIGEGFAWYLKSPVIAQAACSCLEQRTKKEESNPMDTHPPLRARLERIRELGIPAPDGYGLDGRLAIDLVDDLSTLEQSLLRKLIPSLSVRRLAEMRWETVGTDVYLPSWKQDVAAFAGILATRQVRSLPELVQNPRAISDKVHSPPGMIWSNAKRDDHARRLLTHALSLALIEAGWSAHFEPTDHFLQRSGRIVKPGEVIERMKAGSTTAAVWTQLCDEWGIGDAMLA